MEKWGTCLSKSGVSLRHCPHAIFIGGENCVSGRTLTVAVPAGHIRAEDRDDGSLLLLAVLSEFRRGDGHPGAAQRFHQLHPVLLHEQEVQDYI